MSDRTISLKMLRLRRELGLTAAELGKLVGISQAQVSRLESGKQGFRSSTLSKIAEALGVKPVYFFVDDSIDLDQGVDGMSIYGAIAHPRVAETLTSPEFLQVIEMIASAYCDNPKVLSKFAYLIKPSERK